MADTKISALNNKPVPVGADIGVIVNSVNNETENVLLSSLPVSDPQQIALDLKADKDLSNNSRDGVLTGSQYTVTSTVGEEYASLPEFLIMYPDSNSTGANTIKIDANTAVGINRWDGTNVVPDDIVADTPLILIKDSIPNYRVYGLADSGGSGVPTGVFDLYNLNALNFNPTKEIRNNIKWTLSSNPSTITFDNTSVPEGSDGIIKIVNSLGSELFVEPISIESYQDVLKLSNRVGTSDLTVTNCVDNGGGEIRATVTAHGLTTGDIVNCMDVVGTTEATGVWQITVIDANTIDFDNSDFANAYVSGGTVREQAEYLRLSEDNETTLYFYVENGEMNLTSLSNK